MIIKCPECGKEISDQAASCPHCGCPAEKWKTQKAAPKTPEKSGGSGCAWIIVVVLLLAVFIGVAAGKNATQPKASLTQTTTQTSAEKFGNDAETVLKNAKSAFGSEAAVSWTVNGKKAALNVRINDISSSDIAGWFRTDPELAQAVIDELAASTKEANKSTYDLLKNKGHSGFTVEFEMKSSDGFIICTASNGTLTYKMNERNFQNG